MNYKISLAYNGSNYYGWNLQPNLPTIHQQLNSAIENLFGNKISFALNCSGRTDARVHAIDQVVNLKSNDINLNPKELMKAINSKLPYDIRINSVEVVDDNFHARYSCKNKTYVYLINTKPKYDPICANTIYQYNKPIDLSLIDQLANLIVGQHDFLSFSTTELTNTIRTINFLEYSFDGGILKVIVNANGFLRNMVRMIVGTIIQLNEKKITIQEVQSLLQTPRKGAVQYKLPGCGLYLSKVNY